MARAVFKRDIAIFRVVSMPFKLDLAAVPQFRRQ